MMSFDLVAGICNGGRLSSSSIGVVSWFVCFAKLIVDCCGGAEYEIVSVIMVDCD